MARHILVDTCAILKWADGTMPVSAQEHLLGAERRFASVISAWEIQLKRELRTAIGVREFETLVDAMGLELIPVTMTQIGALNAIYALPDVPHKDPFDHMLIAQALMMRWPILTCDSRFPRYPNLEVLW